MRAGPGAHERSHHRKNGFRPAPAERDTKRRFAAGAVFVFALFSVAACARTASCQDAGDFPLRPGETRPAPDQRGLDEVEILPHFEATCPVCGRVVKIPDVDKLMRRPGDADAAPKWRMHAATRDADLSPYPAAGKVAFQADIVICPDCGYAAPADGFSKPVAREIAAWTLETLRPNLRRAQTTLLGKRSSEMTESEIIGFFEDQREIPDRVRTEHHRVLRIAARAPRLEQAEATWLAAWALRRETAGTPKGAFLAKRTAAAAEAAAKIKTPSPGLAGREQALRHLLGRNRSGKERISPADQLAARVLLAGVHIRAGRLGEATFELEELLRQCRERFLRPEQDPLWTATNAKASRAVRLRELERIRTESEKEIEARIGMVGSERELLEQAANLIREAILSGELDGRPDEALFHAYLVGEFLRRADRLAAAAEWFKNLCQIAPEDSDLYAAAAMQMAEVREQAGETVNLLSALGRDGEALIRLREICAGGAGR